jgi:hypothetical protein
MRMAVLANTEQSASAAQVYTAYKNRLTQTSLSICICTYIWLTLKHGLVQPKNIMLAEKDQKNPFCIIDFGSAVEKGTFF